MANKPNKLTPRQIVASVRLPKSWQWPLEFPLEGIERRLRFARTVVMDEHTVRGIRGSDLTVMRQDESAISIQDDLGWALVAQLQKRTGCITGQRRDVILIRWLYASEAAKFPEAPLRLEADGSSFARLYFGDEQIGRYCVFRSSDVDAVAVMLDHRRKWFPHLTEIEARGLATILAARVKEQSMTLVQAYRTAGRMLYQYSIGSGWVKTDVRGRARTGCNLHWLRRDEWEALVAGKRWNPSGCGDETIRTAHPPPTSVVS